ncbi:hypothetical protein KKE06_01610 [Candidatus Micrarchaeota archaeon]|nr:hypothetical protein [Candidatus Micrarchaeota archaeon]MBU1930889.1 hypothetical protein [Candidatus Micrarchaeota archaeon]
MEPIDTRLKNLEGLIAEIKELDESQYGGFVLVGHQTAPGKIKFQVTNKKMSMLTVIGSLEQFKTSYFATSGKAQRT